MILDWSPSILIICFNLGIILVNCDQKTLKLQSVHVLMRHGDRTPTNFYPNDPYQNLEPFPEGLGELNDRGKSRIKATGKLYRKIYESFLFELNEWPTKVWASPSKRAVETAAIFMESFLDGIDAEFQIYRDVKMLSTAAKCPLSDELWFEHITSAPVMEYIESKRELIEYLEKQTGDRYFDDEKPGYTLRKLEFLATTLEIERDEYGLQVPEWAKDQTIIEQLDDLKKHAYWFDWQLKQIQKLRSGLLINNISQHINLLASGSNQTLQRFFLYSSHDVNQVLLLQALGLYDQIGRSPPSYCSGIILEHYIEAQPNQDDAKDFVRVLYRQIIKENQENHSIETYSVHDQTLVIDSCRYLAKLPMWPPSKQPSIEVQVCSWQQFQSIIKPVEMQPEDWDSSCGCGSSSMGSVSTCQKLVFLLSTLISTIYYWLRSDLESTLIAFF